MTNRMKMATAAMIMSATAIVGLLSGCSVVKEVRADDYKPAVTSSITTAPTTTPTATDNDNTSITVPSSSVTVVATPTTSTPVESNPVESNPTESKPVESTPTTSPTTSTATKPIESKPVESNPVEVHTHTFTEATCEKPATCACGETKGNALGHKYNEGVCIRCGKKDPNYVAVHNCKKDGHIWGDSYTKEYTEDFELKEKGHDVYACGFDATLARRYGCNTNPNFTSYFGTDAWSSGSTTVKTTATRTVTEYYHKCSECGATEKYDTDEDVTASDNWVNASPNSKKCPIIWWDVNDIPDEVWDWVEQDKQAREEWINSLG